LWTRALSYAIYLTSSGVCNMAVKILGRAAYPTCALWCTVESLSLRGGPPLLSMRVASTRCTPLRRDSTSIPPPWAASREVPGEEAPQILGRLSKSCFPGHWGDPIPRIVKDHPHRLPLTLHLAPPAHYSVDIFTTNILYLCHLVVPHGLGF